MLQRLWLGATLLPALASGFAPQQASSHRALPLRSTLGDALLSASTTLPELSTPSLPELAHFDAAAPSLARFDAAAPSLAALDSTLSLASFQDLRDGGHRGDALLCGGASFVHAPERAERSRVAFGSRTPHQALRLVKVHVKALPVRVAAGEVILRISKALVRGEPKKLHGLLIISHLSQDTPKKALRPRPGLMPYGKAESPLSCSA